MYFKSLVLVWQCLKGTVSLGGDLVEITEDSDLRINYSHFGELWLVCPQPLASCLGIQSIHSWLMVSSFSVLASLTTPTRMGIQAYVVQLSLQFQESTKWCISFRYNICKTHFLIYSLLAYWKVCIAINNTDTQVPNLDKYCYVCSTIWKLGEDKQCPWNSKNSIANCFSRSGDELYNYICYPLSLIAILLNHNGLLPTLKFMLLASRIQDISGLVLYFAS